MCLCVEAGGSRSSPTIKEYQVPDKEYQVPRQRISGSQQGAIIFQTVKLLFSIVRSTYAHENVDFFGSEMVQNLLSVTVHLPALQNMVITKHYSIFPVHCTSLIGEGLDLPHSYPPPPPPLIPDPCTASALPNFSSKVHKLQIWCCWHEVLLNFKFQTFLLCLWWVVTN